MYCAIEIQKNQVHSLCRKHRVQRLSLFGSAASDQFDPAISDLDFLVEFQPMPPREQAEHYFGLLEDLEALFGIKVDLVELAPIRNPYFRQAVENSRVDLFDAA
ncbi:nucleotidyltransferase family protein [Geoalkalibacter halelectricus]|uniref:Nucleotidyltransferase domain-containing protein n=1 Tax=Geoalkalibacter halelectricus TaxID=2847045 RepID=A0ABY5ZPJ7_9BACT|nr:nucleotidyltransferase domain-containing protein [Geoalkalibacter halelectricus]MDO3378278.1 nucleotidyltransferase domain-containing protein [Geoalkalibacter halelectricus]UWZ79131.1 nucleotidyltransferase domain-containing protein [Geoalkalibacter halelectricus]